MGKEFRVRFAPSPTGLLHIGNARTAILNWLLARKAKGTFFLRIEDTDLERSSRESEERIIEDLRWLGLDWDEGPDVGGCCGPYRQSERTGFYREAAEKLLKQGSAYYCHMTDEQMEEFRRERLARGESVAYRGSLSGPDIPEVPGSPTAVRFRVPEGTSNWIDRVKGEVTVGHETVGDFIILRSDGRPTYNFAVVADDIAMRVSHVIRGDGHLSNTPRQLMLYRALEADPPEFAHIPMILGPDHKLLSKRHGATSLGEYRDSGYLPQALINYLSLLSWSSASEEEFLPVERLLEEIDFERLGKSAAVFDPEKLRWLNGKHIRALPEEKLEELLLPFAGGKADRFSAEQFNKIVQACRDKIELLSEIEAQLEIFSGNPAPVAEPQDLELLRSPEAQSVLTALARRLRQDSPATPEQMQSLLGEVGRETAVKGKLLYMPVRLALTGRPHGPELPRIMSVLGAERCAGLLEKALQPQTAG